MDKEQRPRREKNFLLQQGKSFLTRIPMRVSAEGRSDKYGINSSRNPDVVPAKAGNQYFSHWIPPYPVRVKPGMTAFIRYMSSFLVQAEVKQ
jgi:hypothetical protein